MRNAFQISLLHCLHRFFPVLGQLMGQTKAGGWKRKQGPRGLHQCLQRGQQTFFRQFWAVYSRFCSTLFAFWNSLKPVFPCIPCLSVAVYVVRNRCSTCTLRSGPARSQSKKVVKVKSVCPKHLQYNKNLR